MGKNSERLVPQRSVPRLVHLVASTVASFLGAFAGLVAVLVLLHRFAPAAADAVSITGALLGFLCGGSVGMFCVRAVLGAMDPPAPPDQVAPRAFEAALAELNKPRAGRRTEFWPMLLGSLAIFVALGGLAAGIGRLVLLTAVLGFHEAGHLVAMRAFGYRDARILFIPFLGAVTTGSRENVPGEQRAIVLLAGPVPGLLLGFSLFLLGATHDPVVRQAAGLLIAINAFNLLPLGALDGGKLLDVLLFSRGPLLRAVFAIATSALLGWFAYNRHAWLLLAVAWLGIGAAQNSYKAALAARRLGAREALPQSLEGASPEFLRQLFDLAYLVTPPLLRRSSRGAAANARAMREVHAQAVQRPASLPASALMLSAYVALFALCTVAWSHRHSAPASRHSARAVAAVRNADSR
jgi:Zn-dependent protease